jgi:DNA-binding XRE family transcriptional regulator
MNIGSKIKELRTKNGLSQYKFAEKIGVTKMAVIYWEADKCEPSIFNCIVIADFFKITLDELCGR